MASISERVFGIAVALFFITILVVVLALVFRAS